MRRHQPKHLNETPHDRKAVRGFSFANVSKTLFTCDYAESNQNLL